MYSIISFLYSNKHKPQIFWKYKEQRNTLNYPIGYNQQNEDSGKLQNNPVSSTNKLQGIKKI